MLLLVSCNKHRDSTYYPTQVTRIAKTNIIGLRQNLNNYCSHDSNTLSDESSIAEHSEHPNEPPNEPVHETPNEPQYPPSRGKTHDLPFRAQNITIGVSDPVFLDDLCVLGLLSHVIATITPPPAYLAQLLHKFSHHQRSYEHPIDQVQIFLTDSQYPFTHHHAQKIIWHTWRDRLLSVAHLFHKESLAHAQLERYASDCVKAQRKYPTTSTEVSMITITAHHRQLLGLGGFASETLHDIGMHRPDRINFIAPRELQQLSEAEADIVYIMFTPGAKNSAVALLESQQWAKLGVAKDHRQFIVDYSRWYEGSGLVAAHSIIADIEESIYNHS